MYFLDTTFIVALFVSNDQWHQKAVEIFEKIKLDEFIISKLVIAETITVLKNKLNTKEIREIYRTLPKIVNVIDDYEFFDDAMEIFVKYDSKISFFDSMYIYLMKKENITEIISFDSDFDRANGINRIH
ncbi:type II toxin-antitoxin system VapC family toxin [uncultured Methanobrevibacter sp.]|uniref:type II toxin-antitoxin system VapC family toxin n=1 Tax=uncultured Methanobrevibacter sp. TaxID=253161 RepID=UPI0025D8A504|nr:PIN domain-containing protein [uncultured Methanobrevibacter sp.]